MTVGRGHSAVGSVLVCLCLTSLTALTAGVLAARATGRETAAGGEACRRTHCVGGDLHGATSRARPEPSMPSRAPRATLKTFAAGVPRRALSRRALRFYGVR